MDYRILGRTGVKVSPLCLGTDNFANPTSAEESIHIINRAQEAGINFLDTSNSYAAGESEAIIGQALAQNGRRHQTIITTKVHYPVGPGPNDQGNSRLHIIKACEDSLRRLQTDYIDLYGRRRRNRHDSGIYNLRDFGRAERFGLSSHCIRYRLRNGSGHNTLDVRSGNL